MSISIIVPAWNEERLLGKTLEHLHSARGDLPVVEIIVVDNNSTDATAAIAQKHGAKVVFEKHNQIARARNTGALAAQGEYLFFIDADTWPSKDILKAGYLALQEGAVAVGSVVAFEGEVIPSAQKAVTFWNALSQKAHLAAGSFLLCDARAFKEVGGFPLSLYAAEEVVLSRKLKKWGRPQGRKMVILDRYPITTSARKINEGSLLRVILQTALIFICPWVLRWRGACWLWYTRRV